MIKINLLKEIKPEHTDKQHVVWAGIKGKNLKLPAVLLVVFIALTIVFVVARQVFLRPERNIKDRVTAQPTSRYLNVVEETVREIDENKFPLKSNGMLSIQYNKMTIGEKILYGATFVQRATTLLNGYATNEIDFNTLKIDKFYEFYIKGLAGSRRSLNMFIKELKDDPLCAELKVVYARGSKALPPKIEFAIRGKLFFGLDYAAMGKGQGMGEMPGHSEYLFVLRRFRDLGRRNGIKWTKMKPLGVTENGKYREHTVLLSGISTYKKLIVFLGKLRNSKSKISFPSLSVRALNGGKVGLNAKAFFYSKND